jgi:peptidoglycan hydrolase CwlO-like protein
MFNREELERIEKKQKNAEVEASKLEGKLESVMSKIEGDGYSTVEEYESAMNMVEKELKTIGEELDELEKTIMQDDFILECNNIENDIYREDIK